MNIRTIGRVQPATDRIRVGDVELRTPSWAAGTPLVELLGLDAGPCRIIAKLEHMSPTGSVKDRVAWAMVEHARATGRLRAGMTIVEASSGNTSVAIGAACRSTGIHLRALVPTDLSPFRWGQNEAYGVELDICGAKPGEVIDGATRRRMVEETVRSNPDCFCTLDQFSSPANASVHAQTTAAEIVRQAGEENISIGCFSTGVGTGGTLTGIGGTLREAGHDCDIILADPVGSPLSGLITGDGAHAHGTWMVSDGIGATAVPGNLNRDLVKRVERVKRSDALQAVGRVARATGIMAGPAAGYALEATLRWCREQSEPKTALVIICDRGEHYLGDEAFMQALIEARREAA